MDIGLSETFSERFHFSHRQFLKRVGLLGAGSLLLAAYAPSATRSCFAATPSAVATPPQAGTQLDELGDVWTSFDAITDHNNYNYNEFSLEKQTVAPLSESFLTAPRTAAVGGLAQSSKGSSWPRN